jgi:methylase of polypeptide subunit release factors
MSQSSAPRIRYADLVPLIEKHRSAARPKVFTMLGREWDLVPEVYAPVFATSTELFTRWLPYPAGGALLEIGCGAGVTAVTAALEGCRSVVAVDVSAAAVENTRRNAARHGVDDRVRVLRSDMFAALDETERFDVIYWNSNFVELPADVAYESELDRSFFDPGYVHHEAYLAGAGRHLRAGGRLFLGFADLGNRGRLEEIGARHGWRVTTYASERPAATVDFQLLRFEPANE